MLARADVLQHPHLHAALGAALNRDVVHELSDEKNPAAARLRSTFSGVSGSLSERDRTRRPGRARARSSSVGSISGVAAKSMKTRFAGSLLLPCMMALITDSRTAMRRPVQRLFVQANPPRNVLGDRLNQVQRVYGAVDFEMHILETAGHRIGRSIVSRWLQSPRRR